MGGITPGVFKIGVTGHRRIKIEKRLAGSIREVLASILQDHAGMEIWIYSALAEGSDQFVAEVVSEFSEIKLIVPLPLPVEQYISTFDTPDGKKEFNHRLLSASQIIDLPEQPDSLSAFQHLGHYLADTCDILLALWNGENNLKKGGTGEVVLNAINRGKPVYWIYCSNQNDGPSHNTPAQKKVGEIQVL